MSGWCIIEDGQTEYVGTKGTGIFEGTILKGGDIDGITAYPMPGGITFTDEVCYGEIFR